MREKGFVALLMILGVILSSMGIIAGSYFIKNNHPELIAQFLPSNHAKPTVAPQNDHAATSIYTPAILPSSISITPTITPVSGTLNKSVVNSQNSFGFKLINEIFKSETNQNIFISPASITMALSLLYNAAEGSTSTEMAKALGISDIDKDVLNQSNAAFLRLFANAGNNMDISMANSLWGSKDDIFNKSFLEAADKYYQAKIASVDFGSPTTADTINKWTSDKTKGKISSIVKYPFPEKTSLYLINAVYFKASWLYPFPEQMTKERKFYPSNGLAKMVSMMKQEANLPYLANSSFQAINLPYGLAYDSQMSMYIFLPKNSLSQFMRTLTMTNWDRWMESFEPQEGTIVLPKFKIEYEKDLKFPLKALGMGIIFDDGASFNIIQRPTNVSEAKHKTYIDLNEKGTEAAAVTSIGIAMTGGAPPPQKKFYMEVNKPFFYAIRDNISGTIIFAGVIQEP
ncbi:MAG: serpin family protein [Patescibacteria group bacterium]|nr:serpin family protein [Patescibacteria group bacterium]